MDYIIKKLIDLKDFLASKFCSVSDRDILKECIKNTNIKINEIQSKIDALKLENPKNEERITLINGAIKIMEDLKKSLKESIIDWDLKLRIISGEKVTFEEMNKSIERNLKTLKQKI